MFGVETCVCGNFHISDILYSYCGAAWRQGCNTMTHPSKPSSVTFQVELGKKTVWLGSRERLCLCHLSAWGKFHKFLLQMCFHIIENLSGTGDGRAAVGEEARALELMKRVDVSPLRRSTEQPAEVLTLWCLHVHRLWCNEATRRAVITVIAHGSQIVSRFWNFRRKFKYSATLLMLSGVKYESNSWLLFGVANSKSAFI